MHRTAVSHVSLVHHSPLFRFSRWTCSTIASRSTGTSRKRCSWGSGVLILINIVK